MPNIGTIDTTLRIDTKRAEAQLRRLESAANKSFGQRGMSRLNRDTQDFEKTLGAATNRVVAFGAAAIVFNTLARSVGAFTNSIVEVEKALTDINVNLGQSAAGLKQFGAELFNVSRQTGQTFETAAKAATELARQGLSAEETIKRLKDAMILSRISGLDAASSVDTLTAAINSFNKEALTSSEVVNKFAAVDTRFAVSSKDIAEAVSRVGSTAQSAGVGINELIGLVTSLQQTTARGGATIGNGLKTIFTRIQAAPETVSALQSVGVAIKDTEGNLRSAIDILRDYGQARTKLGEAERASVDRTVAGTFQINILKAALGDLSKEYSVYDSALRTSVNATDEAIKKNEQLNQTLASLINSTSVSLKQLVASIGEQDISPSLKGLLSFVETARKYLSGESGSKLGEFFGEGILKGIANVLSGPVALGTALILFGAFKKIFSTIAQEARGLLQINSAVAARARIQQQIQVLAQAATKEEYAQLTAARSVTAQKEVLLAIQARLNRELLIGTELQNAFVTSARFGIGSKSSLKVPKFADPISSAIAKEASVSGLPKSQIYVDRDPRVASFANPAGLLVANRRDEPLGGFQGVNRVIAQGGNPKLGSVPGFAKKPLLTTSEIVAQRLGIGDPRYDEGAAQASKAAKAVSKLDAALERSSATQQMLNEKAKRLSQSLSLVNKGFESFGKELQKASGLSQYGSPIGPPLSAYVQSKIVGDQSRYSPFTPTPSGTIDFSRSVMDRNIAKSKQKVPTGPFGPAFPINPELRNKLEAADLARKGIIPEGRTYSSPIGPPTRVEFARERAIEQAALRQRMAALVDAERNRKTQLARVKAEELAAQREKTLGRRNNIAFGAALVGPLAAGFVEPGFNKLGISTTGGTSGGIVSGALQGAGQGATLGIFGPQAALIGAALGAFGGILSKSSKSLTEFSEEIDKGVAAQQASVDAVGQFARTFEELTASSSAKVTQRLNQQQAKSLQSVDPEFRNRLKDATSAEDIAEILLQANEKATKTQRIGEIQKTAFTFKTNDDGFVTKNINAIESLAKEFQNSGKRGFDLTVFTKGIRAALANPIDNLTRSRDLGKLISPSINESNIGSIDQSSLRNIIGQKGNSEDFIKLQKAYADLGTGVEVSSEFQTEYAEALQVAIKEFNNFTKTVETLSKKSKQSFVGLLPNSFTSPVSTGVFRNAALTGRNAMASQATRGRADFDLFGELISTGAVNEKTLESNPLYKKSKAITQSANVGDALVEYISGLGGYNINALRGPRGDVRLDAVKQILDRSGSSGSSNAERSRYLSQFVDQAKGTLASAGVKPPVAFTEGVSGITPGADYGAFFKQAQETTNKLVEATTNAVIKTSLSVDGTIKMVSDTLSAPDLQALAAEMTTTIGKQFEAQIRDVNVRISLLEGKPLPPTISSSPMSRNIIKDTDGFYRSGK